MHPAEQNLREKADAFKQAFLEARAAGFSVVWPVRGPEIGDIVISGTARVELAITYADGSPVERDAEGGIVGQPLDLTAEERAALPKIGEPTGILREGISVPADGIEREIPLGAAKLRKK